MNPIHEGCGEDIRALNIKAPKVIACPRSAILLLLIFLAWLVEPICSKAGGAAPSEAQLKAAFILNFPKYVEWPPPNFPTSNSPIVVGIFDSEEVISEFSTMSQGKVVDGHPIQFLRITSISQCRDCHILFIGAAVTQKLPEILPSLQGVNVLTVGESDEFIDRGGMINLARRDRRIVLEVNLDATRSRQLKISSKLMALATVKGSRK